MCSQRGCVESALHHMQVSKIGESGTDYRKFYINNGAKIMRLRAETKYGLGSLKIQVQ